MTGDSSLVPCLDRTIVVLDLAHSNLFLSAWLSPLPDTCLLDYCLLNLPALSSWPVSIALPQTAPAEIVERIRMHPLDLVLTPSRSLLHAIRDVARQRHLNNVLVVTPLIGIRAVPDGLVHFVLERFEKAALDFIFTGDLPPGLWVCALKVKCLDILCEFEPQNAEDIIEATIAAFLRSDRSASLRHEIVPVGQVFRGGVNSRLTRITSCKTPDDLLLLSQNNLHTGPLDSAGGNNISSHAVNSGANFVVERGSDSSFRRDSRLKAFISLDHAEAEYLGVIHRSFFLDLVRHGVDPVIYSRSEFIAQRFQHLGVPVVSASCHMSGSRLRAMVEVAEKIEFIHPDIIYCTEYDWDLVGVAGRVLKIPVVVNLHDANHLDLEDLQTIADIVTVPSSDRKEELILKGFSPSRVEVISALAGSDNEPGDTRTTEGQELVIGNLGHFTSTVDYLVLLIAFYLLTKTLPIRVTLLLQTESEIADVRVYESILAEIQRLGLQDRVLVQQGQLDHFVRAIDIIVAMGASRCDVQAVSLAASAGKPVVIPRIDIGKNGLPPGDAYAGLIDHRKTGLVYWDAASLAVALIRLGESYDERRRLGMCAQSILHTSFSARLLAERWARIYSKARSSRAAKDHAITAAG